MQAVELTILVGTMTGTAQLVAQEVELILDGADAKRLYESLQASRPDLSGVHYGVIALGDRTYADTFCNGGRRFDAILSELGAKRIGDILLHDASAGTMPEELAAEWAGKWIREVR